MIRFQDMTPEVYVSESRDFQLFCRLYDAVFNGVKFNSDDIVNSLDPKLCKNELLTLLQTKIGFFTNISMTDNALRYVLSAFPYLLKQKGNLLGVYQAVYVFLRINQLSSDAIVTIKNNPKYEISIGIKSPVSNTEILQEILKYIVPTGYKVHYFYYTNIEQISNLIYSDSLNYKIVSIYNNSMVRDSSDIADQFDNRTLGAVDTVAISRESNTTE